MMDFISSLLKSGQSAPTVPTDMSQVTVPQMPIDPASSISVAGNQAASTMTNDVQNYDPQMEGLKRGLLVGGINAIANINGRPQQGQVQASSYRGGGRYRSPGASKFMNANMAGGLLSGPI